MNPPQGNPPGGANPLDAFKKNQMPPGGEPPVNPESANEPTTSPLTVSPVTRLVHQMNKKQDAHSEYGSEPIAKPDPAGQTPGAQGIPPAPSPASGDPNAPPPEPGTMPEIPPGPPGTQPLIFPAFGQDHVVHVSEGYDLNNPEILKEQQGLHSARFAVEHTKADGSWQDQAAAIKAATLAAREDEAERWKTVLENTAPARGSDGETQKTMRHYVADVKMYDEAVESGDAQTVALMEENAMLRTGYAEVKNEVAAVRESFEKTREADQAVQKLVILKDMVPSLPGDPRVNLNEFVALNKQPGTYMEFLGNKNYALEHITAPDFPHDHYLQEYQRGHGPIYHSLPANPVAPGVPGAAPVIPGTNNRPVLPLPASSNANLGADPMARGRNVENANMVRDNLGGGSQTTTALGGDDDSKFKEYGQARLYDKSRAMELQRTHPGIEEEFMEWYRSFEDSPSNVGSPLIGGGMRVR